MIELDPFKWSAFVVDRWHRRSTILIVLLILLLTLLILSSTIRLESIGLAWTIVIIALPLSILALWWITNKVPTVSKGKVGILIAITHEDPSRHTAFRNDFIRVLSELLQGGKLRYQFTLLELGEYHSAKIANEESARRFLRAAKAHFLLYGQIRERIISGKPHHILKMNGVVTHHPIPIELSEDIAKEFGSILPRQLTIEREADVFAFELTAQWTDLVCRYIIGIASLMSGDYKYAISLFEDVGFRLTKIPEVVPPIALIKARLPDRLDQAYDAQTGILYGVWRKTKDPVHLQQMAPILDKLIEIRPKSYSGHLLAAICAFVLRRDLKEAKKHIKACRGNKDRTWYYSKAFLNAYEGKMSAAIDAYNAAFAFPPTDQSVVVQTEEFVVFVLAEEPDKVQLWFCLGLINLHGKQDNDAAKRDFNEFLAKCPQQSFLAEQKQAADYIREIDAGLAPLAH